MERVYETWPIERFRLNPKNARIHSVEQIEQIRGSMREFGWTYPVLVDEKDMVIAGHGRLAAATLEGMTEAPALIAKGWTEKQKRAYALADNRIAQSASWDARILQEELGWLADQGLDIGLTGFSLADLSDPGILGTIGAGLGSGGGSSGNQKPPGSLSEKFFAVPFSVLNAREGWWQRRKALWLALGIQSELGRGENLLKMSDTALEPDPDKRKVMQAERAARQEAEAANG